MIGIFYNIVICELRCNHYKATWRCITCRSVGQQVVCRSVEPTGAMKRQGKLFISTHFTFLLSWQTEYEGGVINIGMKRTLQNIVEISRNY